MAIDPKKLLPPSKISSALSTTDFTGFSIQRKKSEVSRVTELSKKYNEQNVDVMRKSLLDVDSLLKSVLGENKTTEETKRKRKEREEFEERESRLELPKPQRKFRLPAVSLPGMSFLDRVKRFLLFTGIGWLFTNFQSQLPKLLGIIKIITPIYGVVENVFKFILSSVVNFIERGYETYDKIRALVRSVGGEGAQQSFDALSSRLNEYINYILIGGMALTGAITAFATNVSKIRPPQKPSTRPTATGTASGRPAVTTGRGGIPVRSTTARITTSGGRLAERNIAKNILRKTVKPALSRLPIVGALIEFGLSWALGDPVGKAAFRGVGSLLVGAVGTAIGGPIGTAIGGIVGGEVGGRVYDIFFGGKTPPAYKNGGMVIGSYAKGGGVIGSYELGRTIEVERTRKPTPPSQSTQPGRDVGGQKEIKKLFPNPNESLLNIGQQKPNPYYALTNTATDFKGTPYGLGALMGGAIDVALGQKLSDSTILNASVGLENMFYDNYDKNRNFIDVRSIIFSAVRSAANSALMNVKDELNKGKIIKKEKPKQTDQTQTATRDQVTPSGTPGGVDVSGAVVGYVGSTGRSSGPHIHIETGDGYSGKGGELPGYVLSNVIVDGKPLSQHPKGDGLGAGRGHQGFDFPIRSGAPIVLTGGLRFVEYDEGYNSGYGNSLVIADSSGRKYLIGHLSGGPSNPKQIKELQEKQKAASVGRLDDTVGSKKEEPSESSRPTGSKAGSNSALLSFISKGEGGYNSMNQGTNGGRIVGSTHNASSILGKNLTEMTVGQIMDLQASGKLFAAGRYQIIPSTMKLAVSRSGVSRDDKFSTAVQDKLGLALIYNGQRPKLSAYLQGKSNDLRGAMIDLAEEWASVPHPDTGRSVYPPANISSHSVDEVKKALQSARKAKQGGLVSSISPSGNYVLPKDSSADTKSLEQYPSYAEGGMRTKIAIQRVIVEKMIPIPTQGRTKTADFRIAGSGVNNNMALHRG